MCPVAVTVDIIKLPAGERGGEIVHVVQIGYHRTNAESAQEAGDPPESLPVLLVKKSCVQLFPVFPGNFPVPAFRLGFECLFKHVPHIGRTAVELNPERILVDQSDSGDGRFLLPRKSCIRVHMVQKFFRKLFQIAHDRFGEKEEGLVVLLVLPGECGGKTGNLVRIRNPALIKLECDVDPPFFQGGDQVVDAVEILRLEIEGGGGACSGKEVVEAGKTDDVVTQGGKVVGKAFAFFMGHEICISGVVDSPEADRFPGSLFKFEMIAGCAQESVFSGRCVKKIGEIQERSLFHGLHLAGLDKLVSGGENDGAALFRNEIRIGKGGSDDHPDGVPGGSEAQFHRIAGKRDPRCVESDFGGRIFPFPDGECVFEKAGIPEVGGILSAEEGVFFRFPVGIGDGHGADGSSFCGFPA